MGSFEAEQSEDCLYLTIWAPDEGARPKDVIVWLHGGGYSSGAGSLDFYSGSQLADRGDVVVVNVNYRLGALGFLYQPDIGDANVGILDQLDALCWVQENIARFGGDPSSVTVMGQSAGAYTISLLSSLKEADGLYKRMIIMSPPLGMKLATVEEADRTQAQFLEILGIDPRSPEKLRDVPVERILEAQQKVAAAAVIPGDPTPAFRPIDVFNCGKDEVFMTVSGRKRECLIGFTSQEMSAFLGPYDDEPMEQSQVLSILERYYGDAAAAMYSEYDNGMRRFAPSKVLSDAITDIFFIWPTLQYASVLAETGIHTFVYEFGWQAPDSGVEACHCIELPFVFGTFDAFQDGSMLGAASSNAVGQVADVTQNSWLDFVKSGEPLSSEIDAWPSVIEGSMPVLKIDATSKISSTAVERMQKYAALRVDVA